MVADAVSQFPERDARAARRRAASERGVMVYDRGQAPLLVPFVPDPEVPAPAAVSEVETAGENRSLRKGRGRKAKA